MDACRICSLPRVASASGSPDGEAGRPAARTPEMIEADRQRLLRLRQALEVDKLSVDDVDKRLKALEREAAGPATKLPHNWFEDCRKAAAKADACVAALEEKQTSVQRRLEELQADADAAERALAKAREQQAEAAKARDEAATALRPAVAQDAAEQRAPPVEHSHADTLEREIVAPLVELQRSLEEGGLDRAIANAEQLYQNYLDSECAAAEGYEVWKAKQVAQQLRVHVLSRCSELLAKMGRPQPASATEAPGPAPAPAPRRSAETATAMASAPPRAAGLDRSSPYRT